MCFYKLVKYLGCDHTTPAPPFYCTGSTLDYSIHPLTIVEDIYDSKCAICLAQEKQLLNAKIAEYSAIPIIWGHPDWMVAKEFRTHGKPLPEDYDEIMALKQDGINNAFATVSTDASGPSRSHGGELGRTPTAAFSDYQMTSLNRSGLHSAARVTHSPLSTSQSLAPHYGHHHNGASQSLAPHYGHHHDWASQSLPPHYGHHQNEASHSLPPHYGHHQNGASHSLAPHYGHYQNGGSHSLAQPAHYYNHVGEWGAPGPEGTRRSHIKSEGEYAVSSNMQDSGSKSRIEPVRSLPPPIFNRYAPAPLPPPTVYPPPMVMVQPPTPAYAPYNPADFRVVFPDCDVGPNLLKPEDARVPVIPKRRGGFNPSNTFRPNRDSGPGAAYGTTRQNDSYKMGDSDRDSDVLGD